MLGDTMGLWYEARGWIMTNDTKRTIQWKNPHRISDREYSRHFTSYELQFYSRIKYWQTLQSTTEGKELGKWLGEAHYIVQAMTYYVPKQDA